ncbi:MAG TPA: trypsin-like peptidase domain-containing protein, partial [Desulfurivibrionaceae bacterium]|nr:trypsin-like peptidase domain-containing protein [Desulfurivibrionaceae bacterium]
LALIFLVAWFLYHRSEKAASPVTDPNAQARVVTPRGDLAEDERNTIALFKAASPSVVFISSIELRRGLFSLNVYEIPSGTGSGFVWDRQGRVVTNFHVIGDASRVEVTLGDGSVWKARLVGASPDKDLAVLQIDAPAKLLTPITVGDSDSLQVGQKVFAIGNPFGLDHTITSGIVSALGREIKAVTGRTIQGVIQTDAAINPGNSGGPLLDSSGRLIGINTAIFSPSGASAGIGFAVPVAEINRVAPELIRHGKLSRPGLGVTLAAPSVAAQLGIKGVLVIGVQPGSSAEKSGLRGTRQVGREVVPGDIIVGVNGQKVDDYDQLRHELEKFKVGATVTLIVMRDGAPLEIAIALEDLG